jgi:5-methylcytosine-specific restriction enzyme A
MPQRVPTHRPQRLPSQSRHRTYDATRRDMDARAFYLSPAWRKLSREKRICTPLCEECGKRGLVVAATMVHHVLPRDTHPDSVLDMDNLMSLCWSCHSRLHAS